MKFEGHLAKEWRKRKAKKGNQSANVGVDMSATYFMTHTTANPPFYSFLDSCWVDTNYPSTNNGRGDFEITDDEVQVHNWEESIQTEDYREAR